VRFALTAAFAIVMTVNAAGQRSTPQQPPSNPGIIFGRVVASGAPAVNVLVTVLHETDPLRTGKPRLSPRNVRLLTTTNRRGEYRLTNIPLGRYYVVAIPAPPRAVPADRRGHAITYHPGALESSEAREVTVRGEPIELDIRLVPTRVSVISGVAYGSNGRPLTNGIIQLGLGAPLFGIGSTTLVISRDGSFTSPPLPPGAYSLQTTDGQSARAMSQVPNPVMSGARVALAEADVSGLRLEPIRRVAVRGRVTAPAGTVIQGLSVSAIPLVSEGPAGPQRGGTVGADGTFEFHTWPGRVIVRIGDVESGPGFSRLHERQRIVRLNGVDVTRTGVDIQQGRDAGALVIELQPNRK
jgi:hypothetical protein